MKTRLTPVAAAAALALTGTLHTAFAQQAAAPAAPDVVVVTGIRASIESSLSTKRRSDSVVEVITAEDIGKMPDKNIADSLQRVPGVSISSASASEGGFDENDRVSLRGTNPSLTQTLINGHMVGSGDWFVLNQVGTVGRSVSYSLLPSELVSRVVVRKSSSADMLEGGVAGTVDIITRKPLEFSKPLTLEASIGAVYADLPAKTDPQFSGLVNWKNDAKTFGVMLQAFSQKRHLRRDGVETLGYSTIAPGSAIAQSNPDLSGVAYPNAIGSALFEQVRQRDGALLTLQVKPAPGLSFELTGFESKMEATNYNRNYLVWGSRILSGGAGQAPDAGYVVRNGTLVQASFANQGTTATPKQYVIVDQILRPGANAKSDFFTLDGSWRASDALTIKGQAGSSKGQGDTPKQAVFEGDVFNTGATWKLNGINSAPDSGLRTGNAASFTGTTLDWIFGASPARTKDKEDWAQIDAEYALDMGSLTTLKFGARSAKHSRDSVFVAQGPKWSADPFNTANLPAWNGQTYPSDFGSGLGGNFLRNVWQIDPGVLEAWGDKYSNRDPLERQYFPGEFAMSEKNAAGYLMANLEGKGWSGNVGVRLVQSKVQVLTNVAIPQRQTSGPGVTPVTYDCAPLGACTVPGAITTSAFGSFYRLPVNNTHNDVLPSANFKFDLRKDLVARVALAKTLSRPDYSALGGAVSLDDTNLTGSGGNPGLKPIRSTNVEAGIEWYFAPRAALQAGVFHMNLSNYVSYGVSQAVYFNQQVNNGAGAFRTYNVSSPINSKGKVSGFELGWQQPVAGNFGASANYTYANGEEQGGRELVGNSKHTGNLGAYYEDERFNARLNYTYRSAFFNGLDRASAQHQAAVANVSASLGWKISEQLSLSLDGHNLNNPVLKYYAANTDQPTALYVNGRQYYITLRAKM
jgi:iron complex outermembrane receptor protein